MPHRPIRPDRPAGPGAAAIRTASRPSPIAYSTISSDGYRFSDNPRRIKQARYGLKRIAALPCDIMLTPHPSGSNLLERLSGREALVDAGACKAYAESGMKRLDQRLDKGRHGEVSWKLIAFAPRAVISCAAGA